MYLTVSSLRKLARLPGNSPIRRLLLPYTIFLFLINTTFAILQDVVIEAVMVEDLLGTQWTPILGCNPALVFRAVFAAVPIFANDLLFVRSGRTLCMCTWLRSLQALSSRSSRAVAGPSSDPAMYRLRGLLWYVFHTQGSSIANNHRFSGGNILPCRVPRLVVHVRRWLSRSAYGYCDNDCPDQYHIGRNNCHQTIRCTASRRSYSNGQREVGHA